MLRIRPVYTNRRSMDLPQNFLILLIFFIFQVILVSFLLSSQNVVSQIKVNILQQTQQHPISGWDEERARKSGPEWLGTSSRQDKRSQKVGHNKTFGQVGEVGFNNSCLYQNKKLNRNGPQTFDCPKFVIDSTDAIWNTNNNNISWVKEKLRNLMTPDWESLSSFGKFIEGYEALDQLVTETLTAFPDLQLHIIDCFCQGNDIDGYKTTMPVIHTATHLGWHPLLGYPTGRKLTWAGIPNCFIKKVRGVWQYTAEINIPDLADLYSQDGVWPPRPQAAFKSNDCQQLFDWDTGKINRNFIPPTATI